MQQPPQHPLGVVDANKAKKSSRLIKCKNIMCGKEFTTRAGLRYHQRTSQNIECQQAHSGAPLPLDFDAVVEKGEVLIFPKGKRGVPLLTLVQTENHLTEEFKCLVRGCGKSYPTRGGLRYHLLGCHRISSPVAAKLDVLCGKKRRQSEKILESVHFEQTFSDEEEEDEEHIVHEDYENEDDSGDSEEHDARSIKHEKLNIAMIKTNGFHGQNLKESLIPEGIPNSLNCHDGKLPPLSSLPSISKYLVLPPPLNRPSLEPVSFPVNSNKLASPSSPPSSSSSSSFSSLMHDAKELLDLKNIKPSSSSSTGILHPKPVKFAPFKPCI